MRSPDLRFRFSLSRTNRSFRGQSFIDRRDSWFFAMVACSLAFFAFGPGRNAISSHLNAISMASGPVQLREISVYTHDESFISFRYCSRPFVLRGAPMKTRGTAHLNQFWCHSESKRVFPSGVDSSRDAVALLWKTLIVLVFECCMASYDASCASEEKRRRVMSWISRIWRSLGIVWRREAIMRGSQRAISPFRNAMSSTLTLTRWMLYLADRSSLNGCRRSLSQELRESFVNALYITRRYATTKTFSCASSLFETQRI
jgi:hypothetical protein